MHGRSATLQKRNESILLKGVENLEVGLYHSWAVQPDLLNEWNLCAVALDDEAPMVIEQPKNMAYAVQFHPESVLTPEGLKMIANWVQTLR
jgi:anthranilate/para-aminobenzoate synthase component II